MNRARRFLCLLAALCLMIPCMTRAESTPADPVVIVSYDRTEMLDWSPGYGLSMPGVLLELSHAEAMLSITAVEQDGRTPSEYLSAQLDRAGETLIVSNARLSKWKGQSGEEEGLLSYSYTYPEGDEVHLTRIYAAYFGGMLIDLTVDAWGEDAEQLTNTALKFFVEQGFTMTVYEHASEQTATLSDVIEDEAGQVSIQLTDAGEAFKSTDPYYPLAENAVLLFPHPDDPLLLNQVSPDFSSLVEAILAYEESSDSPAVFRTIIDQNQIVYMEYGLMQ